MSYIKLDNISFEYPNGFLAVSDLSLEIDKGSNIAIIGQNGAGKTTTVKMLNGLLKPTKGDVFIGDFNTKNYSTAQISRKVGYVFQNPDEQIFHSTVIDEVAFGPTILNFDQKRKDELIDFALKLTSVDHLKDENPFNLPLSLRKMVTIASIIAMDTEVMIFDEPTAGQDLRGITLLSKILEKLNEMGKTLITITHDMEFVANNFSDVIVMANKKIIAKGTPAQVFWDFDVIKAARIKQPYISSLSRKLSLGAGIVNIDEFIESIKLKGCIKKTS